MEANKEVSPQSHLNISNDQESQKNIQGSWITFPFIIGACFCLGLATNGAMANIIVYLIKEYNIKSVDAAQISNIMSGCLNITPIVGAILADAYFGCYTVILFSTVVSLLAVTLFTLTSTISSLRPPPCSFASNACQSPSQLHLAVLYIAMALLAIGLGGTRFTLSSIGASQFDNARQRDVFFNWFFIALYGTMIIGGTVYVYIQDNVSWTLGFGLAVLANVFALILVLIGGRYMRRPKVEGSPFTDLLRVFVAALKKRNVVIEENSVEYYCGTSTGDEGSKTVKVNSPSQSFRFLNHAAVITPKDLTPNPSPWHVCTVQQVEDLKSVLRVLPLWSTSILVSVSIGILLSLTVLQALSVDRHVGPHFALPASTTLVFNVVAVALSLALLDRLLLPLPLLRRLTPLQRITCGQLVNLSAFVAAALIERRREDVVHAHHAENSPAFVAPMNVMWLAVPLVVSGVGEAFHFPAQVALYYQEFPAALKSTSTGLMACIIALGFYLSTFLVGLVRKLTDWLPGNNINGSRLDNVYWVVSVMLALNFGYYLVCACRFKYSCKDGSDDDQEVR